MLDNLSHVLASCFCNVQLATHHRVEPQPPRLQPVDPAAAGKGTVREGLCSPQGEQQLCKEELTTCVVCKHVIQVNLKGLWRGTAVTAKENAWFSALAATIS